MEARLLNRPDHCDCGSVDIEQKNVRMAGTARRRQYQCRTCLTRYTTLEVRVPKNTQVSVLHAKLSALLDRALLDNKERVDEKSRSKEKAGQDKGQSADEASAAGQHQDSAKQDAEQVG